MKAWIYDRQGGPEVCRYGEMPIPEPDEGEVQVRVDGAGMNPVDFKIRMGVYPNSTGYPLVALREFSGVVTKIGRGVHRAHVGDGVIGITERGAAAEFTVAAETAIGRRPKSIDAVEAAVVPLAGMTAWQALFDHGHLEAGQRVLIHAAAGGVGTFAVQLAKWRGAYVIGTASAENHELLRSLGADMLIDYRELRFEEELSDVDLVLHSIGQQELAGSLKVLKPGGRLISILAEPDGEEARRQGKFAERFMMKPSSDDLRRLAELIDSGDLTPVVEMIAPFEEAAAAMEALEKGHTVGKIGLRLAVPAGLLTEEAQQSGYLS